MLATRLKPQKPDKSCQPKTRGHYIYMVVLVSFILILLSYIADIYLLTFHYDATDNNNDIVLISQQPQNQNNEFQHDPCHLNAAITNKIYIYDLPYFYREQPRKHWYKWIHGKQKIYDTPSILNFAFGERMNISQSNNDFYHTHMHSLEILLNERFKSQHNKYFTKNASAAVLFHIPFAFAMHFRFYNVRDWDELIDHHTFVLQWLSDTVPNITKIKDIALQQRESAVFKKYFLTKNNYKPHWLSYTRIAHETDRLTRKDSPFWINANANHETNNLHAMFSPYWHISIDRNCGDPRQCFKRISVPHPSVFHPTTKESLKLQIDKLKEINKANKRNILVSFCGAVRTETRKQAQKVCLKHNSDKSKWKIWWKQYKTTNSEFEMCHFEDSVQYEKVLKSEYNINSAQGRKIKTEIDFSKKCVELYEESMFCLQEGADSTTRKGLWDGIISGCIPIFLNGVMDNAEFECFVGNNYPWYLVLRKEDYIKQIMALPQQFVRKLQNNIMRMIPKVIYTDGESGFADAFDVLMHCLVRKTSWENKIDHPECTIDKLVDSEREYDVEKVLGYDKLYKYLEI